MTAVRDYALGIGIAAIICGITMCFGEKSSLAPLLKLICGLVLAFSAVSPLLSLFEGDWDRLGIRIETDAEKTAAAGEKLASESRRELIKQNTEAYIKCRASDLGCRVAAAVTLSDKEPPVPISVRLTGSASPYIQKQLNWALQKQLGIPREKILWN